MEQKNFLQSKIFARILYGIGIVIVALLIFQAGMFVGFRKAEFSGRFGDNYRQTFGGPKEPGNGIMGIFFGSSDFPNPHGAVGKIIKITLPTIVTIGPDNVEKIILIKKDTIINRFRETIQPTDLKIDDRIVVIGSPNSSSQIEAKLIRIVPAPMMNYATTTQR